MSEAMAIAAGLYNNPRYFSASEVRIRNNKSRRQKIVRRQYAVLTLVLSIILFLAIFNVYSLRSAAQSENYTPEYKYYKSMTVHSGDSLWSIASETFSPDHYKDVDAYISEICKINSINSDSVLYSGESLVVPYYSTEYK